MADTITVVVEGRDTGLSSLLQKLQLTMNSSLKTADDYAKGIANISPAQLKAEASSLRYAQSLARTQASTGQSGQAINTLVTALQKVTPNTNAANSAVTQLQGILNKVAPSANAAVIILNKVSLGGIGGDIPKVTSGISSLVGSLGTLTTAFIGFQAVSFAGDALNQANMLEKTQASVRALAGSQEFYNQILQLSKERQAQFGGSLQENLGQLGQFANLSKRTGVDIEFLTQAAARLAAIDQWSIQNWVKTVKAMSIANTVVIL